VSTCLRAAAAKNAANASTPTHRRSHNGVLEPVFLSEVSSANSHSLFRTFKQSRFVCALRIHRHRPSVHQGRSASADFSPTLDRRGTARRFQDKILCRFGAPASRDGLTRSLPSLAFDGLGHRSFPGSAVWRGPPFATATRSHSVGFPRLHETFFPPKTAAAVGACAANNALFVGSDPGQVGHTRLGSFQKPCCVGPTSAPIGAVSRLAPSEPTAWPHRARRRRCKIPPLWDQITSSLMTTPP